MNIVPEFSDFKARALPGRRVSFFLTRPLGSITPLSLFRTIRRSPYGFILESGHTGGPAYVGAAPFRVWQSKGRVCTTIEGKDESVVEGDPFELLEEELNAAGRLQPDERLPGFRGGAVGYFSYDMVRHLEHLPELTTDDPALPDACFLFVDRFYRIDPTGNLLTCIYTPRVTDAPPDDQYAAALDVLQDMSATADQPAPNGTVRAAVGGDVTTQANMSPQEFAAIVERAREYILAGDIFQVNLSLRFASELKGDPLGLYEVLREVNPSPYMSYFDLPEQAIVSASPELLLKVDGRTIETRPIAGTRPRGASEEEDIANAEELTGNEKERAEHVMLVDLERNDLGRVARFGSVQVNELMGIERYSHVIHIVSNVRAELAEGKGTFDAVRACFPGGTITGAPKVRSMEIIEELETHRRGLYTGSIGWLGFDGDALLNIVIRTIVVTGGVAYAQAGAGIVADSVPEREYHESVRKAEAALAAITRYRTGK